MKGLFLVEPVMALYAFSFYITLPLEQQYVYRVLWVQLTNTSYPTSDDTSRCTANSSSSNQTVSHDLVQRQASLFGLYEEVASIIPSVVVTLMLVAYSDRGGRKITIIMPLIGALIYSLALLMVSVSELNIYLLVGFQIVRGLFGNIGTFLGGCFAYITDLCENAHQKAIRIAALDMTNGLFSGVASLITGYFLRAAGFNWPFLTACLCQFVCLLYAIFILEETVKKVPLDAAPIHGTPQESALKVMVFGVYQMFEGARGKTRTVLILFIIIFSSSAFANIGGLSLITLYELNAPLCWDEILIGYGSALSTAAYMISFLGVAAFMRCGVPMNVIVLMGIMSIMVGMTIMAFTKTTLTMFLVRVPFFFSIMPFPILRAQMSKIIPKAQQGALFACLSCMQTLSIMAAIMICSAVYAATVAWFSGFAFLFCGGVCFIPLILLGVVSLIKLDVAEEVKQPESSEEYPAEGRNNNKPLFT